MAAADVGIEHHDHDGAGSCGRVSGHRLYLATTKENKLATKLECSNHHVNLIEGSVMASMQLSIWPWLYSATLFLGMGGSALRLIHSVKSFVERRFSGVVFGQPPEESKEFAKEFRDLAVSNWKGFEHAINDNGTDEECTSVPKKHRRALQDYEAAWNVLVCIQRLDRAKEGQ